MTVGLVLAIRSAKTVRRQTTALLMMTVAFVVLAPFASVLPDGLEAALSGVSHASAFKVGSIMAVLAVIVGIQFRFFDDRKPAMQRIQR